MFRLGSKPESLHICKHLLENTKNHCPKKCKNVKQSENRFLGENEWAQWARAQMNGPNGTGPRVQMNGPKWARAQWARTQIPNESPRMWSEISIYGIQEILVGSNTKK